MADTSQNTNSPLSSPVPSGSPPQAPFVPPPKMVNTPVAPLSPRPAGSVPFGLPTRQDVGQQVVEGGPIVGASPKPYTAPMQPVEAPRPSQPTVVPRTGQGIPAQTGQYSTPIQPPIRPANPQPMTPQPFGATIPTKSAAVDTHPAPLYVRPSQNTTEPSRPGVNNVATQGKSAGAKEYKSSIRTMSDDISNIKIGQQPSGVTVEKVVPAPTQTKPIVTPAPTPRVPFTVPVAPSVSVVPKPVLPTTPTVSSPAQTPVKSGIVVPQVGMTLPKQPEAPKVPFQPVAPPSGSNMVIPPAEDSGKHNKILIVIPVLVLVLGVMGAALWMYMSGSVDDPSISPSVTPIVSVVPALETLDEMLALSVESVPLTASNNSVSDFNNTISKIVVVGGEMKKIVVAGEVGDMGFLDTLDRLSIAYPTALKTMLGGDKATIVYGQNEVFDEDGKGGISVESPRKLVFISEVENGVTTLAEMRTWEASMSGDLANLFGIDERQAKVQGFADNAYQGSALRFRNFPHADKSIDYSLSQASNGKTYLILGNSKEAFYATIDRLR